MRYTPVDASAFHRHAEQAGPLLAPWEYADRALRAHFTARSFAEAGRLAAEITRAADEVDHHPDIDLRYPGVLHIVLTTHATGGVTEHDVRLAEEITRLARALTTAPEPGPGA